MTVNSKDEQAPPLTHTLPVHSSGNGKVTTEIVLDPLKHYDVYTSSIAGDPPIPSQTTQNEIPPYRVPKPTLPQRIACGAVGTADRRDPRRPPPRAASAVARLAAARARPRPRRARCSPRRGR